MKPSPHDPTRRRKPRDDGRNAPAGDLPESEVDLTSPGESSSPQMPHERDETAGMTDGEPRDIIRQAARDVEKGLSDTSRAIEADRAYQRQTDAADTGRTKPRR